MRDPTGWPAAAAPLRTVVITNLGERDEGVEPA
jgi:hypothetical protein